MNKKEAFFNLILQRKVFIASVIMFLVIEACFTFWLMPGFIRVTGGGILDMAAAYKPARALEFLGLLNGEGLTWYNRIQILDILFPLSYGLALANGLSAVYQRKYDDLSKYSWILMVPILGAVCDLAENLLIRFMILLGESAVPPLGTIISILSTLKFLAIGLAFLFIFTGLGFFIKGRKDAFKK
ncbi:MAG: hypothetical protein JEY99_12875 [Spirochaetales bacterium]|nr:hypothetical protein [Spirochaetales bacterium]